MWIVRFQKIEPRDYNTCARLLKKSGFIPRRISPIIFVKALIMHFIEKKSWRRVAWELSVSHIALYKFYQEFSQKEEYRKIFHVFAERRIIVFIGENKSFTSNDLDNNEELYLLTVKELESIL